MRNGTESIGIFHIDKIHLEATILKFFLQKYFRL